VSQITTLPVGAKGIDYAFSRPDPASLRASGFTFAGRYVSIPPASKSKNATADEIARLHAAGLAVFLMWEMSAGSAAGGYNLGMAHGKAAGQCAQALNYPKGLAVPAAFDVDTTPMNLAAFTAYGHGFADGIEPYGYYLGVYGDCDIINALDLVNAIGGRSHLNHIAGASSWSHGEIDKNPLVHIRQTISSSTPTYDGNFTKRPVDMWLPRAEPSHPDSAPDATPNHDEPNANQEDDDMSVIIVCRDEAGNDVPGTNPYLLNGGYVVGLDGTAMGNPKLPVQNVEPSTWQAWIDVSNNKKAADEALKNGISVNVTVPPITVPAPEIRFPTYVPQ
jgi:hypothetical protein